MKNYIKIFLAIFSILLYSCSTEIKNEKKVEDSIIVEFSKIRDISHFQKTEFVPTFESELNLDKNNIYSTTSCLAWAEIKNILGSDLSNFESKQLQEINDSKSFINTLSKNEYNTECSVNDGAITAKAYFKKALPFKDPLTKFDSTFIFDNIDVETFGFKFYCDFAKINYYLDKNNFSISLYPKDENHEIIIVMMENPQNSFKEYFTKHLLNSSSFTKNRTNEDYWKHYFSPKDRVEIPCIDFNIEKNYNEITNTSFNSIKKKHLVNIFYQNNAFILNETGAIVESEFIETVDAIEDEQAKIKIMLFNKPFVVFLKRKDAYLPYFSIYIENTEILKPKIK
jgi:hypothetical protein